MAKKAARHRKTTSKPVSAPLASPVGLDGEALFMEAERRMGQNAGALVEMSLLAYDHRESKEAMRVLSSVYGRNARRMSRAVARYPEWFYGTLADNGTPLPPRPASPDELLALFEMCQLSKPESDEVYKQWRSKTLRAWEVRDLIEAKREQHVKPPTIRLREATLENVRAGSATLRWQGEQELGDFRNKKLSVVITDKTRAPDDGTGEDN